MLLEKINHGKIKKPERIIIYGVEGCGKSTFCSHAPNPIFIPTEDGLSEIECDSFPVAESFEQVMEYLKELASQEHEYKTIVIDTLDWLEPLISKSVCNDYGVDSIFKAAGGFNRGFSKAVDKWAELTNALDWIRNNRGMRIVMIAHSKTIKVQDPENPEYDKYSLRLNDLAANYLMEWADCVMFASHKMVIKTTESGKHQAMAVGRYGGDRVLRTISSPTCNAKNRYNLPEEIPLDWEFFEEKLKR